MKIQICRQPKGIAIVIVMICIFVLAMLAGGFAYSMKVETKLAMNSNNETEMEWMGRSGVEMARYVLGQQLKIATEPFDALSQKWAGGPGDTNGTMSDVNLADVQLGHGKFSVKITDTERKFNINTAMNAEPVLQQAFTLIGVDGAEIPTIIASIEDWIDRDENQHLNGAESEYYQALNPPYMAKNGPIDDLSELLFIKGITPDIYWGPNAANHPAMVMQPRDMTRSGRLPTAGMVSAGLVDIFTPISNGLININTASMTVLQMIPGVTENVATEIVRMRAGPDGVDGTEDDMPWRSVNDLAAAGLGNAGGQAAQLLARYCGVRSSTFEVEVNTEVGMSKRKYLALLRRNTANDIQVLSFHWE